MERVTEEEVLQMSIEELGRRLVEAGWAPIDDDVIDGEVIDTVFAKTFNVNDYKGLDEYLMAEDMPTQGSYSSVIVDPTYMTYELDIQSRSGSYYFWTLGDNPNNAYVWEDFVEDPSTFSLVVAMVLNKEFATVRSLAFSDIWKELWKAEKREGNIPVMWLTLVQAVEEWDGYLPDAVEKTIIEPGNYAIKVEYNSENSPVTYVLIDKEEAKMIMNAEDEEEAFSIMESIVNTRDK